MNLKQTIKSLGQLSNNSKGNGYLGDASEYSFRRHCLLLFEEQLEEIKKLKKSIKTNNSVLRDLTKILRRLTPDYIEEEKEEAVLDLVKNPELKKIAKRVIKK